MTDKHHGSKLSIAKFTLEHAQHQYNEDAGVWRDLERKGQANVAIVGLFLTGTSLMFRTIQTPEYWFGWLYIVALIFLVLAAYKSLTVLFVSEYRPIEDAKDIIKIAETYGEEISEKDEVEFILERARNWEESSASVNSINWEKSGRLKRAHDFLEVAIVFSFLTSLSAIFLNS